MDSLMRYLTNILVSGLILTGNLFLNAQDYHGNITVPQYIEKYKDIAMRKMSQHKIPASITLAQGILESANGNSDLAQEANNHFGIKCHEDWKGETFYKDDDQKHECFRKYKNAEESFEDHTRFLSTKTRYAFLFDLEPTDYKGWAHGLKKAGYATDPAYPQRLMKIIEENRLYEMDRGIGYVVGETKTVKSDSLKPYYKGLADKEVVAIAGKGANQRKIMKNNRVKFIIARKGDGIDKLCDELDMRPWQIKKYNELDENAKILQGDLVYLQPKRRRAEQDYHVVKAGENLYMISQLYGVKLKLLYRKNRMEPGTQPTTGQKLWLRKKKPRD
jgi:hypothetical protein